MSRGYRGRWVCGSAEQNSTRMDNYITVVSVKSDAVFLRAIDERHVLLDITSVRFHSRLVPRFE